MYRTDLCLSPKIRALGGILFCAFLIFAHSPLLAASTLQVVKAANHEVTSGATSMVSISIAAGDLAVVWCSESINNTSVASISDSSGGKNVWTQTSSGYVSVSPTAHGAMFYSSLAVPLTSVTCTWSGGINGRVQTVVYDISGAASSGIEDSSVSSTNTNNVTDLFSNASGNTLTTTNANDILLFGIRVTANQTSFAPGTNYAIQPGASGIRSTMSYRIVSSTQSAVSTDISYPTAAINGQGIYAAFKAAAGTGGTGPSISSLSPNSGTVGATVVIAGPNFGASQGTSTVTFNGTIATPTSWSDTSITVPVPSGATSGNVVVNVGGVASNPVAFTVIVPPSITSVSPTFAPLGASVTITGTNFGASQGTSTVTFNGVAATPTSWSATSIIAPVPSGATSGNVVVTVGGLASNGISFRVAPWITSVSPMSGPVGTSVTITGTSFGATQGTSAVTLGASTVTPTSWSDTVIVAPVPAGATTGNVIVMVNGVGSNRVLFTVTPTISSVSPTSGPVGTSVTITGSNFGASQGTSTVAFNGAAATPTSWSDTAIVVPVPTGATTGNIVVTVGGFASNGVAFTVLVPPSITSLGPTSGPVGTSVTITGINFGASQGTSTVTFNGTAATPTSWSATTIVVPVPSGATTGNVILTVNNLSTNGGPFTVLVPPSITSLSPTSGPVGTSVTITGTNFGASQGTSTVTFNAANATPTSWSATSIVVPVPSGATTGNIVVTVGGLTTSGGVFTVTPPPPTITSLNPTSAAVGALVSISGTNFGTSQGTSTVTFNGTPVTQTSWSPTLIIAPVPAGATSGNVVVTVGGIASNGVLFTLAPPPNITSLNPASGPVGASMTISGANFGLSQGNSTVTFNGAAAKISGWNDTTIFVTVPAGATTGNVVVTVGGFASNGVPFTVNPISVSVSPTTVTLGTGAQQIFYLTVQNDIQGNGAVTWSLSGAGCSGAACGTIQPFNAAPGEVYTAPAVAPNPSTVTLTATSVTDPTKSASATITINQTTPSISALSPTSGPAGMSVNITGANFGVSQGTSTVTFNGTSASQTNWSPSSITVIVPSGATTGNVVVTVGGFSSNGVAFTVTNQPNITGISPSLGPVGTSVTITGTNFGASQGASTVTFGGTAGTPASWSSTTIVVPVPAGVVAGSSPIIVTVGGLVSNSSFFGVAPVITSVSPISGPVGASVTVSGSNFGASQGSSSLTFNGTPAPPTTWSDTRIVASVPSGATTGGVVVTVGAIPSNGPLFTLTPGITSLSPNSGLAGTAVTITGTSLGFSQGTSTVTFNGVLATPISWSNTSIFVQVPSAATTGNVVLTVGGFASNGVLFTVPPSITSLSPTSAPVGNSLTVTGTNFGASQSTSTITFNGTSATPTSWSNTSIVVPVPTGATTGNVVVTVNGFASNGRTFNVVPSITALSPTSGSVGTSVMVTGTSFGPSQGTSTLTFNGTFTAPTSWSDTSITVPVPAGATSGNVIVTVAGFTSNGVVFTVVTPPNITGLSPASGSVGTSVTITGANFGATQGTSTVDFSGTLATPTSWSATSITVLVPTGATSGNVIVSVGGQASNGIPFTVTTPPANIALVQHVGKDAGTTTTTTLAFNGANTTGNFIAVAIRGGLSNSQVFAVKDSNSNTYKQAKQIGSSGSAVTSAIYYAENINAGANTITVTMTVSGPLRIDILEYSGVAASNSLDATTAATTTSTSPDTGSLTTTANGDLLLAMVSTADSTTFTVGSSYTIRDFVPAEPNTKLITEDQIQSSAGTASATATLNPSSNWGAILAAFKAAGGTGGGAGTPASITATAGTPQSATVNTSFATQLQVTVKDSSNNPVSGAIVTFSAPGSGASGTFAGGVNAATTNASGVAISAVFTANTTAGSYTVTASVSGVASPANFSLTNLALIPTITGLNPTSGPLGTSVTITGTNFGPSQGTSTVAFNGAAANPTSWTATSVVVSVPTGATTGNVVVTVGGIASNGVNFTVAPPPPPPSITTLSPSSAVAGGGPLTLTVNGTNFVPSSTVQWNGNALATTFLSGTQLQATVTSINIAAVGAAKVTVSSASVGGGVSNASTFFVGSTGGTNFAAIVVNQAAQDIVYDPLNQVFYLSVPSTAATNPNTIAVLDPATATITFTQPTGNNPNVLAISDDSQFLYAGIDGASTVQRFILPGLTPDISYPLGTSPYFGPYSALDLQVAPGAPHTTAVSLGNRGVSPAAQGGITIFDDATPRTTNAPGGANLFSSIQWGADAATLYASNTETSSFDFYTLSVSLSGITLNQDFRNEFDLSGNFIHFNPGTNLIYSDEGQVINPVTGLPAGNFNATGATAIDSTLNTAFIATSSSGSTATIESFDIAHFTPINTVTIANVGGTPLHLIRWAQNGLAFINKNFDGTSQVVLLGGDFVSAAPPFVVTQPPAPVILPVPAPNAPTIASLNPSSAIVGSAAFVLNVAGAQFDPAATVRFNGAALSTTYVSSTQLQALVPTSDVASPGSANIIVANPPSSGGNSSGAAFFIGSTGGTSSAGTSFAVQITNQASKQIAFDSQSQRLYLSVPNSAATGNTIAVLDPATATIVGQQYAGSNPGILAISDDGQYLYAGIDGSSSVQRFLLPGLATDMTYSLGAGGIGPYFALDLQVAPGASHTTAVTLGAWNSSPVAIGGIEIFDDATARPTIAKGFGPGGGGSALYDSLQWGADATVLFASNTDDSAFDFYTLSVTASGVSQATDNIYAFSNSYDKIHFDKGTQLIYADNGQVINPVTGASAGTFTVPAPFPRTMVPDSSLNLAFFVSQTGSSSIGIYSFNLSTFAPVSSITIPNVSGNPIRLIRWGQNGLAFNTDAGQIVLVGGNFIH